MRIKEYLELMKEIELEHFTMDGLTEDGDDEIVIFWDGYINECLDRELILEDIERDKGIIWKIMVKWNDILTKHDLGFSWFEYSIEDYFRGFFKNEFNEEDIKKMMYDSNDTL